jgi:hypothetical protein
MSEPIFYSILRAKAGEVSGIAGLGGEWAAADTDD